MVVTEKELKKQGKELEAPQKSLQDRNKRSDVKRYSLTLPSDMFQEVQAIAKVQNTSVLEMLKRFVRLGLIITKVLQASPENAVIIREGGRERELVLV